MAKKIKGSNDAPEVTTGSKRKRKAGKDIVPRLKVIDGQSFILMASSRGKNMQTALLWAPAPKDPDKGFMFLFDLPDGDDGTMMISMPMGLKQAQAVYAGHPRRVPKDEMPPECPLEEVVEPEPEPKAPKAPPPPATPEG